MIYWELTRSEGKFFVNSCFYVDRVRMSGEFYAIPLKQKTKVFNENEVLEIVSAQLDRTFYGFEVVNSLEELTTEEFISVKLHELKKEYKFLIFVGEGESINELPATLTTRLANRIHRRIFLKIVYEEGRGVIKECYYCDRKYKSRSCVTPDSLVSVFVEYNRNSILNFINNELNCDFTDVIIADNNIDLNENNYPLCGNI